MCEYNPGRRVASRRARVWRRTKEVMYGPSGKRMLLFVARLALSCTRGWFVGVCDMLNESDKVGIDYETVRFAFILKLGTFWGVFGSRNT